MARLSLIIDASRAKQGAQEFERSTRRAQEAAKRTTRETDKTTRAMDRMGRRAATAGAGIKTALAGISAAFIARDIVRTAAGFEAAMLTVKGVTGATEEEFQRLNTTARNLGATTRFSAQEAAQGLLFLARAGFTTQQAIAAIPATLNLAAAGELALGEAADFTSNILSQFGLRAEETERVVDTLIKTANSANTDVRQLAEAMKFAGPVAGALGISVEQTSAALGVLGDSGVQASLAGTNLRGSLAALLAPTSQGEKALKRLGIALEDVNPARNDLVTIYKRFADANLDAAAAVDIFGRRNAAAALILSAGVDKVRDLTQANKEARGEAQRLADLQATSLTGAFKNLRSAIEEAFLATGDTGLLGAFKGLINALTGGIRIVLGMADASTQASVGANAFATAIKAAGLALGSFVTIKAVSFLGNITTLALGAAGALRAMAAAALANPLVALAGVAAATAASLFAFRTEASKAERQLTVGEKVNLTFTKSLVAIRRAQVELNKATREGNIAQQKAALIRKRSAIESQIGAIQGLGFSERTSFSVDRATLAGVSGLTQERIGSIARQQALSTSARSLPGPSQRGSSAAANQLLAAQAAERAGTVGSRTAIKALQEGLKLLDEEEKQLGLSILKNEELAKARAASAGVLRSAIGAVQEFLGFQKQLTEAEQREANANRILSQQSAAARAEYIAGLQEEVKLLGLSEEEREKYIALQKLGAQASEEEKRIALELIAIKRELLGLDERANAGGQRGGGGGFFGPLNRFADAAQRQAELERSERVRTANLGRSILQGGSAEENKEAFESLGAGVGLVIAGGIEDGIITALRGGSLDKIGEQIAEDLARVLIRELITKQIAGAIGGAIGGLGPIGSLRGNAFQAGRVIPHQLGGVLDRPVAFPLRNGVGTAVEDGQPEAILPLKRGRGGRLGVSVASGGGGRPVNITLNVNGVRDADSFRRSERQIGSSLNRALKRAGG